jgi:hypothetical protein
VLGEEDDLMREFSLGGFIEHLGVMAAEVVIAEHEGLERAAQIIDAEAKNSIGHYQDEAPPFAAWADLAESTKADRVSKGFSEDEPELRTGELRDSIQHKVVGREAEIGSDSPIMEYQELGTVRIPPRSILGGAAVRKGEEAAEAVGEDVVAVLIGERIIGGRLPII